VFLTFFSHCCPAARASKLAALEPRQNPPKATLGLFDLKVDNTRIARAAACPRTAAWPIASTRPRRRSGRRGRRAGRSASGEESRREMLDRSASVDDPKRTLPHTAGCIMGLIQPLSKRDNARGLADSALAERKQPGGRSKGPRSLRTLAPVRAGEGFAASTPSRRSAILCRLLRLIVDDSPMVDVLLGFPQAKQVATGLLAEAEKGPLPITSQQRH
jgi:hypothetical protein